MNHADLRRYTHEKARFLSENGLKAEKPGFEPGRRLSHPTPLAEDSEIMRYNRKDAHGTRKRCSLLSTD